MKKLSLVLMVILFFFFSANSYAQFKEFGLKGGVQLNGALAFSEFEDDNGKKYFQEQKSINIEIFGE